MKIEDLTVEVRPRTDWEAVDLGLRMVRLWWRPLYGSFICIILPVWLILTLVFLKRPWLVLLILWWLKPILDRAPLFVLSRKMFGANPSLGETLRALPAWFRRSPIGPLSLFRFSPRRAISLPVLLLENLQGRARWGRQRILENGLEKMAYLTTILFFMFEWFVIVPSLFGLTNLMIPQELGAGLWETPWTATTFRVFIGFYVIAVIILEPMYVATGFSLYLNRRTLLEGWDLELRFRRLAKRLRSVTGSAASVLVGALFLLNARYVSAAPQERLDPKQVVEEVMASPEFARESTNRYWRLRQDLFENTENEPAKDMPLAELFSGLIKFVFWGIGIVIAAVLVVYLIRLLNRSLKATKISEKKKGGDPTPANFGEELARKPLPTDVVAHAVALWESGKKREALSLLFRGALKRIGKTHDVNLSDFATEEECLALVRRKVKGDSSRFFAELTLHWQQTAYAHREPTPQVFQGLCERWTKRLGGAD